MLLCYEKQMAHSLLGSFGSRDWWREGNERHSSSIEQQHWLSKVKQTVMKILKCSAIFGTFVVGALAAALCATVTLTSNDIVKMSKAGVSDDVIIQTVQSTGSNFRLTAQDVEALKRSGVSDRVVVAMLSAHPAAPPSAQPSGPTAPVIREPGGPDYAGMPSNQQVVRALPVAPPAYYQAPPPPPYYYDPYYYPSPGYYYGAPVGVYFGYGGGHRRW